MRSIVPALLLSVVLLAPDSALAYVGPGAGLSLLGALWALLAAVGAAVFFLAAWPVRRMLRRRRNRPGEAEPPGADKPRGASSEHRAEGQPSGAP